MNFTSPGLVGSEIMTIITSRLNQQRHFIQLDRKLAQERSKKVVNQKSVKQIRESMMRLYPECFTKAYTVKAGSVSPYTWRLPHCFSEPCLYKR